MSTHLSIVAITATALALASCADMSQTEQRTLSGAAIGGVAGTAIGAIGGNAGLGAAIGVAAGAGGGYLWDRHKKSEERNYQKGYDDGRKSKK
jgi:osmotically inducible lipoprotein OsmB